MILKPGHRLLLAFVPLLFTQLGGCRSGPPDPETLVGRVEVTVSIDGVLVTDAVVTISGVFTGSGSARGELEGSTYVFREVELGELYDVRISDPTSLRAEVWNALVFDGELTAETPTGRHAFVGTTPPAGQTSIAYEVTVDEARVAAEVLLRTVPTTGAPTEEMGTSSASGFAMFTVPPGTYDVVLVDTDLAPNWNMTTSRVTVDTTAVSTVSFVGTSAAPGQGQLAFEIIIDDVQVLGDVVISAEVGGSFTPIQGSTSLLSDLKVINLDPGQYRISLEESTRAAASSWNQVHVDVTVVAAMETSVSFVGVTDNVGGDPVTVVHNGEDTFGATILDAATFRIGASGFLRAELPVQWAPEGIEEISWGFGGETTLADGTPTFFQVNMRTDLPASTVLFGPGGTSAATGPAEGSVESNPLSMEGGVRLGDQPGEFILALEGQEWTVSFLDIRIFVWGATDPKTGSAAEIFIGAVYPDLTSLWTALRGN